MRRRESYNPLLTSYPDSTKINRCSEGAEILYVRLLAQSDDAGRYYGDPGWIVAKLFTARQVAGQIDAGEIERRLAELEREHLIQRYMVGSDHVLQIVDVFKTLRKDVKKYLLFPEELTASDPDSARSRDECGPDAGRSRDVTDPNPGHTCNGTDSNANGNGPLEPEPEPDLEPITTRQTQTTAPKARRHGGTKDRRRRRRLPPLKIWKGGRRLGISWSSPAAPRWTSWKCPKRSRSIPKTGS
jgi:hypothetical protein